MQANNFRLQHLFEFVQRIDTSVADQSLNKIGLSITQISDDEAVLDTTGEARFLRLVCDDLGDPTLGAKAGLEIPHSPTLTGYIARCSKDVAAAIDNSSRFYSIVDKSYSYSLRFSGNAVSFEIETVDATFAKYHRHKEFLLFGALTQLRNITKTNFFPLEMRFDHQHRSSENMFQRLAGCPVVFGAEKTEMILSNSTLQIPIPTYDSRLRKHLTEYGERLLQDQPRNDPSIRARIEGVLTKGLPNRLVPANEVAASLGLSARTMARRLTEDGESFRGIVDDLRLDLAKTYLKDKVSVTEIAFFLDYSDTAAFSTAFKRWTGVSPREFQRSRSWIGRSKSAR